MPNESRFRVSRRTAISAAVLPVPVLLAGCDDTSSSSGTPGARGSTAGQPAEETPTTDPVVVAALSTAATQVTRLSLRYTAIGQKFPALRAQLAAGVKYHASHLARLKETDGVAPARLGKQPAVPATTTAALTDLASREKAAAAAHAAAAAKVSGPPARLLAMIAAAESQLSVSLTPKKKATR